MKSVTVLGSTGSIGISTLDVIANHPDQYKVHALVANTNVDVIYQQVQQFKPEFAVMVDQQAATSLKERLGSNATTVLSGEIAAAEMAAHESSTIVMAAIVGAAGLLSALAAVQAGKTVLLANKEALVMSGAYFMQQAKACGATLLPVDSEHNAIFQSLPMHKVSDVYQGVEKITLTASGGPFRQKAVADLVDVTPDEACAHPNWSMGRKISVDSASMMNKGLELIEAHWLFDMPHDKIDVLVHPESIIHSMVSYTDGSVLAQLGNPDMRTPIAHALAWPERIQTKVKALDLSDIASLHFEKPDFDRFPCLKLAYEAIEAGGIQSIVLNAANEIAVDAFLNEKVRFVDIHKIIRHALEQIDHAMVSSLEEIIAVDKQTRKITQEHIKKTYI